MSSEQVKSLKKRLETEFSNKFPSHPKFFEWHCDTFNLKTLNQAKLAQEVNEFLVSSANKGILFRGDIPFTMHSALAGSEVQVKILSEPIRKFQQEIEFLARQAIPRRRNS